MKIKHFNWISVECLNYIWHCMQQRIWKSLQLFVSWINDIWLKKSHSTKYRRNTIAGHLNKPCDSLAHWPIRWIAHESTTPHICCGIYYVRITHTRTLTNTSSRERQSLVTIAQYLFISNETLTIDNKPLCETPIWWWIP